MASSGRPKQKRPSKSKAPLSFAEASKLIGTLPDRVYALCRSYMVNAFLTPDGIDGGGLDAALACFVRDYLVLVTDADNAIGVVGPYAEQLAGIYGHVSEVPTIGTISASSAHEVCVAFWRAFADQIRGVEENAGGMTAEKLRPFWNNLLALPVADTATAYIRAQHDLAQVRITLERERMQILQPSITDADWEWRSAQEIAMLVPEAERPALVKKLRREGNAKRLSADCYRKVKRNEDDDRLAHQPDHLYRSAHPEVRALIAEYLPK